VDGQGVGNGLCVEHFQRRKIRRHQRRAFSSVQTLGIAPYKFNSFIGSLQFAHFHGGGVGFCCCNGLPCFAIPVGAGEVECSRFACSMLAGAAVEHFLKGHYFGLPMLSGHCFTMVP
jgi:hypothetical protein